MATPEGKVKTAIMKYLRARGHFVFVHSSVGIIKPNGMRITVGMKGVADIIGLRQGGQFMAIEVKSRYGRPTPEQLVFLENVRDLGGIGIIAKSIQDCVDAGL
jgi:hypothetical protein